MFLAVLCMRFIPIFGYLKQVTMKKITLLLGAALIMGTAAFAGDGKKEGCCAKGKKEACHASKDKKDEKKGTAQADAKKAEPKGAAVKKS